MNRLDKTLGRIPGLMASHPHILGLIALGVYLVVLPLLGAHVSNFAELLGGNYTNVTSAVGAAIAAGGTVHLAAKTREQDRIAQAALEIVADLWHHHTGFTHPAAPGAVPAAGREDQRSAPDPPGPPAPPPVPPE